MNERWGLRIADCDLETLLDGTNLSPKRHRIAYNLIRSIMLEAAQTQGREPLRISFKRTADGLRQWTPAIRGARGPARNRRIEALIACKERR